MKVMNRGFRVGSMLAIGAALASCAHGTGGSSLSGSLVDSIVTPTYYIDIRSRAGDLDANDLTFFVENRKQRTKKVINGERKVVPCPEGEKHCVDVVGYKFQDGPDEFFISEGGRLTVMRAGKTVLWERGDWEEEGGAGQ